MSFDNGIGLLWRMWDALGKKDVLSPVFDLLKVPQVPLILSLALLVAAVLIWYFLKLIKLRPITVALLDACRYLETIRGHTEFAERFEEISQRFEKGRFLSHAWKEFKETLILPHDDSLSRVRNSRRPDEYFNTSILVGSGVNLRLYEAIPNYFVGIGLLLTFVGLVAAIHFAAEGVTAGNVTQAQQKLGELLGAATFKFLTSIAGLIASIGFSFRQKRHIQHFDRILHRFCRLLEERTDYVTREIIGTEQLEEQKRQTTQLEKFNTDLAVSIAQELDSRLANRLGEALQPLAAAVASLGGNLGTMNQEALGKMISEFTERLEGTVGREIQGVVSGLQAVRSTFDGMLDQIKSGGTAFTGSVSEAASRLTNSLAPMGEQLARFDNAVERLSRQLGDQIDSLTSILAGFSQVLDRLRSASYEMAAAGAPIIESSKALVHAASTMTACGEMLTQLSAGLAEAAKHNSAATEASERTWLKYQQHFESVDEGIARVFQELRTGTDAFRQQVQEFVHELDGHLGNATKMLRRC